MSNIKVEEELRNFGTVWMTVVASLCFCYFIATIIKQGATRFFVLLPVMLLFLVISLKLNTIFLGSLTCFFISWLATFKLLLFAFGKGPLSSDPPHSLLSFISLACFPIKFQENPDTPTLNDDDDNYPVSASQKTNKKGQKPLTSYLTKALLLATMIFVYQNKSSIHPTLFLFIYSIYVYTSLELILAIVAAMVRFYHAVELEPQFDDPYLATSVQDFWSRRWNIMVSKVLRASVYIPVRAVSKHVVGENWAAIPAIIAVFIVSGIMHEWVFYIMGRSKPQWDIMVFFVLHGVCMSLEIIVKRSAGCKWRLPPLVSGTMTVSFVTSTSLWLFLPGMMRCKTDEMAHRELVALFRYVKNLGTRLGIEKYANCTVLSSLHN